MVAYQSLFVSTSTCLAHREINLMKKKQQNIHVMTKLKYPHANHMDRVQTCGCTNAMRGPIEEGYSHVCVQSSALPFHKHLYVPVIYLIVAFHSQAFGMEMDNNVVTYLLFTHNWNMLWWMLWWLNYLGLFSLTWDMQLSTCRNKFASKWYIPFVVHMVKWIDNWS